MKWLHPVLSADDLRADAAMTPVTMSDWVRIGKYVRGELPEPWPEILEMKRNFDWVGRWREGDKVVLDTEYIVESRFVYQVGIFNLSTRECMIWDRHNATHYPASELGYILRDLIARTTVVSQNLQAEMLSLNATWGIGVRDWPKTEDTMLMMAAMWSELKKGLGFLASLYGRHDKVKHLGPGSYEYLRGDVVETANVYSALRLEMMNDEQARLAYADRMLPLVPILCECKLRGIDINPEKVQAFDVRLSEERDAQLLRAQAYAGWPLNVNSGDQLAFILSEMEDVYSLVKGSGIRRKKTAAGKVSFDKDKVAELLKELEARGIEHPLIEARKKFNEASHMHALVIKPMLEKSTVYPDVSIHTQTTGRWSYTDPPMSVIPAKYRGVLSVPEGYVLVSGDWSAIEQRFQTWYTDDEIEKEVYAKGWDGHIVTTCLLFDHDLPPDPAAWEGDEAWRATWDPIFEPKDDKRRVFAKAFKYSLSYGKSIENLPTIPGAKKLGMKDSELIAAGKRWLASKPGLKAYWDQSAIAAKNGIVRSLWGRPRRLLNNDIKARTREAMNAPFQMVVAEVLNETVIMVDSEMRAAYGPEWGWLVMTTHDSTYWALRSDLVDVGVPHIQRIHERPLYVKEGVYTIVPFDIEVKECT